MTTDAAVIDTLLNTAVTSSDSAAANYVITTLKTTGQSQDEVYDFLTSKGVPESLANEWIVLYYAGEVQSKPSTSEKIVLSDLGATKENSIIGPSQELSAWGAIAEFMDNILDNFRHTCTDTTTGAGEGIFPGWTPAESLDVSIYIRQDSILIEENSGGIREDAFQALCKPGKSFQGTIGKSVSVWGVGTKYGLCALGRDNSIKTHHYRSTRGTVLTWNEDWYTNKALASAFEPSIDHYEVEGPEHVGTTRYEIKKLTGKGLLLPQSGLDLKDETIAPEFSGDEKILLGFDVDAADPPCGAELLKRWLSLLLGVKIHQVAEETQKDINIKIYSNYGTFSVENPFSFTHDGHEWSKSGNLVQPNGEVSSETAFMNFPGYEPMIIKKKFTLTDSQSLDVAVPQPVDLNVKLVVGLMPEVRMTENSQGAGYYLWGNGRLFDIANRSLFPGSGNYPTFKPNNARMAVLVFFECESAKLIPWTFGTKWGFTEKRITPEVKNFLRQIPQKFHSFASSLQNVLQHGLLDPWNQNRADFDPADVKEYFDGWGWMDSIGTWKEPIDCNDGANVSDTFRSRTDLSYVIDSTHKTYRGCVDALVTKIDDERLSAREFFEIFLPGHEFFLESETEESASKLEGGDGSE